MNSLLTNILLFISIKFNDIVNNQSLYGPNRSTNQFKQKSLFSPSENVEQGRWPPNNPDIGLDVAWLNTVPVVCRLRQ